MASELAEMDIQIMTCHHSKLQLNWIPAQELSFTSHVKAERMQCLRSQQGNRFEE
jgi:hypothetical protein